MKNKTYVQKKEEIVRNWHFVDASGQVLGSLASDVAQKIMGKNKPSYSPNLDMGDNVVVTNAAKIAVTGNKMQNKIYYRHTGYPGGLKSTTLEELFEKDPAEVLRKAVWGMLPNNKLRKKRITHLYIYAGSEHPHKAWEASQK